jgi:hypothetical protein
LRIEVECLEAELVDLGPTWTCTACPTHTLADEDTPAPRRAGG